MTGSPSPGRAALIFVVAVAAVGLLAAPAMHPAPTGPTASTSPAGRHPHPPSAGSHSLHPEPTVPPFDNRLEWPLSALDAHTIWTEFGKGQGVRIAEVDTGIDRRVPDLRSAVSAKVYDLVTLADRDHGQDVSAGSHGTIIAGLIAARGPDVTRTHVVGLAPLASLIDIRVAVQPTEISSSLAARAIVIAVRAKAAIITVSLKVARGSRALRRAIGFARSHHCAIVAAAGSPGQPQALAQYAGVVVVAAATRSSAPLAAPTQANPVTLYAPGDDLESTSEDVRGAPRYTTGISGNSYAAAYVSAAIALMLSAGLGPADHAARLVVGSASVSEDDVKILDVLGAIRHARKPPHPRGSNIPRGAGAGGGNSQTQIPLPAVLAAIVLMLLAAAVFMLRRPRTRPIPVSPAAPPKQTGPDPSYEGSSWDTSW